jgi:sulfite reductase beta subunit-like hemoprotein
MTEDRQAPDGRRPIPGAIAAEIAEYEEQIRQYRRGQVDEVKMQKFRLQFGTYAQRQDGVQMVRIKLPGGVVTSDQLVALADAADRFGSGFVHFTTREDAQLYYVSLDAVPALLRHLASYGITTREACGNTVRNITACYRAGTSPTEVFDVTPYARALFGYLVRNKYNQVMGRKFKIAFEGCTEDHSAVAIHDLGFVARVLREAGAEQRGFEVYVGGGLGGAPMLARRYTDFLPAGELFTFAAATVRLFDRYGERKSRMKARMKFLVQTLGWERFRELLDEERERVGPIPFPEAERFPAHPPVPAQAERLPALPVVDPPAAGTEFDRWARDAVFPHRVPWLRGVQVRLRQGDLLADRLRGLAEVVRRHSANEARVSIAQNLFLPWVRADELAAVHAALRTLGLADPGAETIADITTCPGADTCRLGIASAKGLGAALSEALEDGLAPYAASARELRIKISGCPNGCAQHGLAHIGFHSAALTQDGRTVPAYLLFVGGGPAFDRTSIGHVIGRYPARSGVRVLETLLALYAAEREDGEDFNACMARLGDARLKQALAPYQQVPAFEDDPLFFEDWGHEHQRFAVRQGVKGECAGSTVAERVPRLEDALERLAQGEAYFAHAEYQAAALAAYEAAAAGARVPLYRRLVDPFTAEQALWEFENIFVLSGETGGAWRDVSAEFERLRGLEHDAASARAALERAREFVAYCGRLPVEPGRAPAGRSPG